MEALLQEHDGRGHFIRAWASGSGVRTIWLRAAVLGLITVTGAAVGGVHVRVRTEGNIVASRLVGMRVILMRTAVRVESDNSGILFWFSSCQTSQPGVGTASMRICAASAFGRH